MTLAAQDKLLSIILEWWKKSNQRGQSILEVIVAMAIFSLIGSAIVTMVLGGFAGLEQGGEHTQAEALAQEGIEAVGSIRDGAWNEILYTQVEVQVEVSENGSQWILSEDTEEDGEVIGQYTRIIVIENVCRDEDTQAIAGCPGDYTDVHSKKVTVTVNWEIRSGVTNSVQRIAYLTNWDSQDWTQTDWSGGSGQTVWSDETKYDSDDGNIDNSTAGEIKLAETAEGSWVLSGGTEVTHTSDTDFNAGTFTDTEVSGTGNDAKIVLTQSTAWAEHTDSASATTEDLKGLSIASASDIWAVGKNGAIIHFDGSNWTATTSPTTEELRGVHIYTSSDGWAVGKKGKVLHYDGNNWTEHTDTGNEDWNDVIAIASNSVWVVGDGGKLAYYDGNSWTESTVPSSEDINGVYAISASDIWAAGKSGRIWHYDGSSWTLHTDTGKETWNDIVMISASDGWVVGNGGALAQYDGTNWTESTVPSSANINGVYAVSISDIWAVGESGRFWRYDGTSWSLFTDTGDEKWQAIYLINASDGWAVGGNGNIRRWLGTSWDNFSSPTGNDLNDVEMVSATSGWVVGNNGTILRFSRDNLYVSNGYLTSSAFDMTDSSPVQVIEWDETLPSGSDIKFQIRAAATQAGLSSESWSSYFNTAEGELISTNYNGNRWIQYKVSLTGDGTDTPILQEIRINYK